MLVVIGYLKRRTYSRLCPFLLLFRIPAVVVDLSSPLCIKAFVFAHNTYIVIVLMSLALSSTLHAATEIVNRICSSAQGVPLRPRWSRSHVVLLKSFSHERSLEVHEMNPAAASGSYDER